MYFVFNSKHILFYKLLILEVSNIEFLVNNITLSQTTILIQMLILNGHQVIYLTVFQ